MLPGAPTHPLEKGQAALWLLLAVCTPLLVNFWVEQQFEASKVWLLRTLIWLSALLWLGGWLNGLRRRALPPRLPALLTALVLVLCLSFLLSPHRTVALFGSLDRANGLLTQLSYLLLFACVATQIDSAASRRLLTVLVLTGLPICLLGLLQAGGWQPLPLLTDARSPLTTTLGRANFTGAYLALLVPLTLVAAQTAKGEWQRWGFGALVLLELAVIALAQARTAWIAVLVGVGVWLWLQRAPRWPRRLRWLTGLGGVLALGGGLLLALRWGIAAGGSIAARWTIWQASLRLLWPRLWLGYGADTLELHFPSVYPPQLVYYQGRGVVVDRAHNWLLDWSLSYGVVATLLLAVLVWMIVRTGWKRLSTPSENPAPFSGSPFLEDQWIAACLAAVAAQLVGNLFLFEVAATALVFWLLLAVISAAATLPHQPFEQIDVPRWIGNSVLAVGTVILCWVVWQANLRPLLADLHSWRGTQALGQGNPTRALAEYRAAVAHQPRRAAYRVAVAFTAAQLADFGAAEESMWGAIALRPTDPVLYTQLAALYAQQSMAEPDNKAMAYGAYERAIALAPTIGLTYRQYADSALRLGDWMLARTQAVQAVNLDATDGAAFGILGWAELHAGNLAQAHAAFAQAVKWQPRSADFHLGLATVYFQQGAWDAARQAVQRSLLLDPAYAPALALQAQLPE